MTWFRTATAAGLTWLVLATLLPQRARAQGLASFDANTLSGWRVMAGVGELWESNVRLATVDPTADLTTRVRLEAARLWRTPRDRVELTAGGALVQFGQLTDLDRRSYNVSLLAARALTRRLGGTLDVRAQSDLTTRAITSVGEGLLLRGPAAARTNSASGGLAYRVTRLVGAHVGARYQDVTFDTPSLPSGWITAANAGLSRRQSRTTVLSLDYEYRHSEAARQRLDAHQLAAVWTHRLSTRLAARASAGGAYQVRLGSARGSSTWVGDASLHYQRLADGFDADYQRSVGQEFGEQSAAARVTDGIGVAWRRALTDRVRIDAGARHVWSEVTGLRSRRAQSDEGTVNLRYALRTGIAVGVGGFVRRRDDLGVATNRGVTLGVGYGWSQLRSIPVTPTPEGQ